MNNNCLFQKELKELSSLDLMECPITEKENYRNEVFTIIPHLIFLDGIDRRVHSNSFILVRSFYFAKLHC